MNLQPLEGKDLREDGSLDVHSIWKTIQGEGPFAGTPAVFVRLAGCNLQCSFCDTDYTSNRQRKSPQDAVVVVRGIRPSGLVVLTGGEPFRQNIYPFVVRLLDCGYQVQVETNGIQWLPLYDWNRACEEIMSPSLFLRPRHLSPLHLSIVCSPKTAKVHLELAKNVSAWKYILQADHVADDGLPSGSLGYDYLPARPPSDNSAPIFVQPLDEGDPIKDRRNVDAAVASCMEHGYRLSLQTHKLLGLP